MKLLIMGIQGSGKGSQSNIISRELGLRHISIGDLVRKEIESRSEIGMKIKEYSDNGLLAPNELIEQILFKNLPKNNFILDGYPRNIEQAKKLDKLNKPDKVVFLGLEEAIVIERLSNRRHCPRCGEQYGA